RRTCVTPDLRRLLVFLLPLYYTGDARFQGHAAGPACRDTRGVILLETVVAQPVMIRPLVVFAVVFIFRHLPALPLQARAFEQRLAHDVIFEDLFDAAAGRQGVADDEAAFGNSNFITRHERFLVLPDAIDFDAVGAVGVLDDPVAAIPVEKQFAMLAGNIGE